MTSLKYHRPKTLDEALELLKSGRPLAGGTWLTPNRRGETELVDLQRLGLDTFNVTSDQLQLGAMLRLQDLVTAEKDLPQALIKACRLEAGLNLRNMATLAGSIMAGDGRSPLLVVLLALQASLKFAAIEKQSSLDDLLNDRDQAALIIEVQMARPDRLSYDQVARSPADRPIVGVCVARHGDQISASIGGYGPRPIVIASNENPEAVEQLAASVYENAQDHWASSEYRSEVAGLLTSRLIMEVMN